MTEDGEKTFPSPEQNSKQTATYIRGVGDQLAQEDFLVRVEGVDDQRHQLLYSKSKSPDNMMRKEHAIFARIPSASQTSPRRKENTGGTVHRQ